MKTLILSLIVTGALALPLGGGVAFAAGHLTPGTPGTANCAGQTTAYLAQAAKNGIIVSQPGIGNLAATDNLSVQQVKAIVDAYCAAP